MESRIIGLDTGRIVGIVLVIIQHLSGPLAGLRAEAASGAWLLGLSAQSFARFSVPLFVMISGALLLRPSTESASGFLGRRVRRVAVPLAVWSLVYFLFSYTYLGRVFRFNEVKIALLRGLPYNHLYFLYAILGLYLITPILRDALGALSVSQTRWLTGVALGGVSLDILIRVFTGLPFAHSALTWSVAFFGYYLLGRCLVGIELSARAAWVVAGVWLLSALFSILLSAGLTNSPIAALNGYFANIFSPFVMVMAASAFVLLPRLEMVLTDRFPAFLGVAPKLASMTFGVYLVHELFVGMLYHEYGTIIAAQAPWIWMVVTTVLVSGASLLVVWIISSVRFTRWIVGGDAR